MKIATYNINGINGRLNVLLRWLKETAPDIVCLQELKAEDHRFPEGALKEAGYHAVWIGQKTWNGVAILSRSKIRLLRDDLPGDDAEFTHSRYIEVFTNDIVIGCLYLPNGNPFPGPKFDYKLRWFNRLSAHAANLVNRDLPVMLVGDYNVIPTERDTYKPEKYRNNALFRTEVRAMFEEMVGQGWTDAIRTLHPEAPIYTFWDYLRDAHGRNAGLRIDHFLLNPKIAPRLSFGGVDRHVRGWEGASDHAPVWIELASPGTNTKTLKKKKGPPCEDQGPQNELKGLSASLELLPVTAFPGSTKPMKATLVNEPFDDPGWMYEIKWDGYRAIATLKNHRSELISRNHLVFEQFGQINELLESWDLDVVLDGEIVALNDQGTADFSALQNWRNDQSGHLAYYVFDILWYQGWDLTSLPLVRRREILDAVLPKDHDQIRQSQVFEVGGIEFFEAATRMGLEGIMAKKAGSVYTSDTRSRDWLKIKVQRRQEVVIAGFTRNEGTVKNFSALILGIFDKGKLRYAGKVGTGFNSRQQGEMMKQFESLITDEVPFEDVPDVDKPTRFRPQRLGAKPTWLRPTLVCEVNYAEITEDGVFRQASFKGMRDDKRPVEVVLEKEQETATLVGTDKLSGKKSNRRSLAKPVDPGRNELLCGQGDTQVHTLCGHELKFTNLNKIYWPEDGITKRDMFNYYHRVADYILPYLLDRPMSLNRFPNGIHGPSFYQKDVKGKSPDWITKTFPYTTSEGEYKEYLVGADESYLLWMASLGCIEMNPWFSRVQSPECPDFCVVDLDPDQNTFDQVIEVALKVKELLDAIDVPVYPKTSGSTGMHLYIPLEGQYSYEQSQLFAKIIVSRVHQELKEFTSLERKIKDRGGKMYLDFLQNRPGATIAGAYSLRPKPGATVSMPLSWDEVRPGLTMRDFTIHNAADRLKETGDLFKGVLGKGIDLANTIQKARSVF